MYTYTWIQNGSSIESFTSLSNQTVRNFTSIRARDVGNYSCVVSNGIQPDGVAHMTLTLAGNQKIIL